MPYERSRNPSSREGGIGAMSKKTLTVELTEDLYERFIEAVTEEGGPWRG